MSNPNPASNSYYNVRPGTVDQGQIYHEDVVALLALKLFCNQEIADFSLSSDCNQCGALDDVVLEVKYTNGIAENYYIQIKHKTEAKSITKDKLGSSEGDYSLQTYFESYKKILKRTQVDDAKFILFTNSKFGIHPNSNYNFKSEDRQREFQAETCNETCVLKESNMEAFKFKTKEKDWNDFLQKFRLYPNQKSLKELLQDELNAENWKNIFGSNETSFQNYLRFIAAWNKRSKRRNKLSKKMLAFKLAEIILERYTIYPTSHVASNTQDILSLLSQFKTTLIQPDPDVEQFFRTVSMDIADLSKANEIAGQFELAIDKKTDKNDFDLKQRTKILWHQEATALIIKIEAKEENLIYKAINMCEGERKFVLLGNADKSQLKISNNFFEKLCDLPKEFYETNKDKLFIALQGRKKISVEALNEKCEITKILGVRELIKMVITPTFNIGGDKEEIKDYVSQRLRKRVFRIEDIEALSIKDVNLVFVISFNGTMEEFKTKLTHLEFSEEKWFDKIEDQGYENNVMITNRTCSPSEKFEEIVKKNVNKLCVHFKLNKKGNLEWIPTINVNVMDFSTWPSVDENWGDIALFSHHRNCDINILCADAGIGKTFLMKYFKQFYASEWVEILNCREFVQYFGNQKDHSNIMNHIMQQISQKYSRLESDLIQEFQKKNLVVLIWDGIDELPSSCLESALQGITTIRNEGVKQWITSRNFLKETLEFHFNTFAIAVSEFDSKQQTEYFKKRLHLPEDKVEEILTSIRKIQKTNFLGIPLQLYLLTKLLEEDMDRYIPLFADSFSIADLLHYFVQENFAIYYKEKAGFSPKDSRIIERMFEECKKFKIGQYETLALKTYLPQKIWEKLHLPDDGILEEFKKSGDYLGMVVKIYDESAEYRHQVFGEFFLASWLSRNYNLVELKEFIFEDEFRNVRFLFDAILAKDCPVHLAILHKRYEEVETIKSSAKDKGGRTPLHIVSSWGESRKILKSPQNPQNIVVPALHFSADDPAYKMALEKLIEKYNVFEIDEVLKGSPIDYADLSLSLLPLEVFSKRNEIDLNRLKNFRHLPTVLVYCAALDYSNLFGKIEEIPYFEDDNNENYLHMLARCNRTSVFLSKIFKSEIYKKSEVLNKRNRKEVLGEMITLKPLPGYNALKMQETRFLEAKTTQLTPLMLATVNHNNIFAKILVENGATVNGMKSDDSPLILAVQGDNNELIDYFLEKGADINHKNHLGNGCLLVSAFCNNYELTKRLINKGAHMFFNNLKQSPLRIVVLRGNLKLLELLLSTGQADIASHVNEAIVCAAEVGNEQIFQYLIKQQKEINPEYVDFTPLHVACRQGHLSIVKCLLKREVKIDCLSKIRGVTPLHLACSKGHFDVIKILIEHKADVNLTDSCNVTPLRVAYHCKQTEIVNYLLEHGAIVI